MQKPMFPEIHAIQWKLITLKWFAQNNLDEPRKKCKWMNAEQLNLFGFYQFEWKDRNGSANISDRHDAA